MRPGALLSGVTSFLHGNEDKAYQDDTDREVSVISPRGKLEEAGISVCFSLEQESDPTQFRLILYSAHMISGRIQSAVYISEHTAGIVKPSNHGRDFKGTLIPFFPCWLCSDRHLNYK
jgi:hypothetical protein